MQIRKTYLLLIIACVSGFVTTKQANAQVQSRTGVRATGMGGAFLAVSNDVNALKYSPAGLINSTKSLQLGLSRHGLFNNLISGDISATNLSFFYNLRVPAKAKNKVIPVVTLEADGIVLRTRPDIQPQRMQPDLKRNRIAFGAQYSGVYFPGQDQHTILVSVAAGFRLKETVENDTTKFVTIPSSKLVPSVYSVGLTARYIYFDHVDGYLRNREEVNNEQEWLATENFLGSHDVDVGALALDFNVTRYFSHKLQIAFSILNVVQPNLAAKANDGSGQSGLGEFARRWRIGAAYRFSEKILGAVDFEKNNSTDGLFEDYNIYIGAEYRVSTKYAPLYLRSGINGNWFAAGFGLKLPHNFVLNGVYQYNLHLGDLGNFRFALNYGK